MTERKILLGLTAAEAARRLKAEGFNELPSPDRRTLPHIVVDVLKEPMFLLLLAGGAIYLVLGSLEEAIILAVFASLSVLITVVQETRTERVLDALRDLTSPRALVIRDGERRRIPGREVVRGDLLVLAEGDRVPADALLRDARDLQADESLLTGESVPVRKVAAEGLPSPPHPGGDGLPYVFSGALVVRGQGIAEATATGSGTEIGKIGQTLHSLETAPPRLQAQVARMVRAFALFGAAVSALVFALYGFLRGGWLDALLAGIAIGMSMLPEEFPVVLTVFMAMGAWRISRAQVLTRKAAAIETLGSATVLCTDKTGTLTLNKMSIAEMRLPTGEVYRPLEASAPIVPDAFLGLLDTGILGSDENPHDPMERAFHHLGEAHHAAAGTARGDAGSLVRAYGLRPELLAMSNAWQRDGESSAAIATKGAPEAIAELCRLDPAARAALRAAAEEMAAGGMRVLGVARAVFAGDAWPQSQRDFAFTFLGLVGLADPLRPTVPDAVRECRSAGIRVVIITGDYPATARAIAREAGLGAATVVTGDEIEALDDTDLAQRVRSANVFARIMPVQKLRIVETFKANGEVVAMTGDGVNDAPSLKAAHIGIAMGGRGTDVAREAAAIVLLDDDFGSIVKAVALGRRIYDNLRKAMGFVLAVHVPIAGLALLPLFFGFPLLLGPVHIAFLEMIIDPVCSLAFEAEAEERDIMRRPPRNPGEALFSLRTIAWSMGQGLIAFILVATVFVVALRRGMPETEVRALAFFALTFSVVSLIFVNRSFNASIFSAVGRPNRMLWLVLVGVVSVLALSLAVPAVQELFRFGPLHTDDVMLTAAVGVAVLVVLDLFKLIWLRRCRSRLAAATKAPAATPPVPR